MPRWFLVRHGETEWNVEGRAQGSSDTELSEVGLYQAGRLSARLAHTPFEAIYSSDLLRAVQTAQVILGRSNVPLLTTPELRELSYGDWEGMTYGEVQAQNPALYAQLMKGDVRFAPPGGESVKDLLGRVKLLAQRLALGSSSWPRRTPSLLWRREPCTVRETHCEYYILDIYLPPLRLQVRKELLIVILR